MKEYSIAGFVASRLQARFTDMLIKCFDDLISVGKVLGYFYNIKSTHKKQGRNQLGGPGGRPPPQ